VKSGDVLGKIADRYGVSVRQLREWNDLSGSMIRIGQKLLIHANPKSH
jgi:membrane-bound lytic murein transglycosylase D